MYKEDYYFTEEGVAIPIRWSSPESLNVSESVIETKKVNTYHSKINLWYMTVQYLKLIFLDTI